MNFLFLLDFIISARKKKSLNTTLGITKRGPGRPKKLQTTKLILNQCYEIDNTDKNNISFKDNREGQTSDITKKITPSAPLYYSFVIKQLKNDLRMWTDFVKGLINDFDQGLHLNNTVNKDCIYKGKIPMIKTAKEREILTKKLKECTYNSKVFESDFEKNTVIHLQSEIESLKKYIDILMSSYAKVIYDELLKYKE